MGLFKKIGKGFKKLGKNVSTIAKKNRKGVGKLVGAAGKVALGAAATAAGGVIAAKAASYGAGVVNRVAGAPARRKAKKEKEARITKALAADIARPTIHLTASRDPDSTTAMPGGSKISGARSTAKKNKMTVLPGGASLKAPKESRITSDGLTSFLRDQVKAKRASDKKRAADVRKAAAAEKKAAAAAKRAEKKAMAAEKKRAAAAERKAKKEGTLIQSVAAGALGVKVGSKGTMGGKISGAAKRKVQSLVRSTVKKSPGITKALPAATAIGGVLYVGGKALSANAAAQVRKTEKRLGRKLTAAEVKAVTTPRNTFLGK